MGNRMGTVICFRLKMRQQPNSSDDNVITMLVENQEVKIIKDLDEWFKVEAIIDNTAIQGYVVSDYIKE